MELQSLLPHERANAMVSDPKPEIEPVYSLIDDLEKVQKFQKLTQKEL